MVFRELFFFMPGQKHISVIFLLVGDLENNYNDGLLKLDVSLKSTDLTEGMILLLKHHFLMVQRRYITESKDVKLSEEQGSVNFTKSFPGIKKWSAEKPNLYSLVICLKDKDGKCS